MFKSILYLGYNRWVVKDSSFTFEVRTSPGSSGAVAAIILAYKHYNLPIIPNLAQYYYRNSFRMENIKLDRRGVESLYPSLKYTKNYYSCVLNQFKMLTYSQCNRF